MSEKKKIWEKPSVQIGIGVLLYFLLRGGNSDQKTKTENKPVDIKGNENEVTKGVKIQDVSLIRIDPTFNIGRWFKDGEFFGKKPIDVPKEEYSFWEKLSVGLSYIRAVFGKPVIISKGYKHHKTGRTATIVPQNKDYNGLWNSTMMFVETNPKVFKDVVRLPNNEIQITIA